MEMGSPWPRDIQIIIFTMPQGWKCGLPLAKHGDDIPYREAALQLHSSFRKS
jgi:hypothetical protein